MADIKLKNAANTEFSISHNGTRGAKAVTSDQIVVAVETINDFPASPETGDTVIVKDINRGGTFIYDATQSAVNNGGTVFDGWVRQYSGAVNVKWFGAKGDGLTDDNSTLIPNIQNAIDYSIAYNKDLYLPNGIYKFSIGLEVISTSTYNNTINIYGSGVGSTVLTKITDSSSSYTFTGSFLDSAITVNINAAISLISTSNYIHGCKISNLEIQGNQSGANSIGIYAPFTSRLRLENILVRECNIGFKTLSSWITNIDTFQAFYCSYGVYWESYNGTSNSGTTLNMTNCGTLNALECSFYFQGLWYSVINNIFVEGLVGTTTKKGIAIKDSEIILKSYSSETLEYTESIISVDNSKLTLGTTNFHSIKNSISESSIMKVSNSSIVTIDTWDATLENRTTSGSVPFKITGSSYVNIQNLKYGLSFGTGIIPSVEYGSFLIGKYRGIEYIMDGTYADERENIAKPVGAHNAIKKSTISINSTPGDTFSLATFSLTPRAYGTSYVFYVDVVGSSYVPTVGLLLTTLRFNIPISLKLNLSPTYKVSKDLYSVLDASGTLNTDGIYTIEVTKDSDISNKQTISIKLKINGVVTSNAYYSCSVTCVSYDSGVTIPYLN